ncbi:hypothetical protein PHISCL_01164, partial [Aspergillus sclerotialis]
MVHVEPSKPYRPIRPRTSVPDGSSTHNTEDGKLKRASIACTECKRRRVRCSDGIPCTECSIHDRNCVYNELADKRRKIAAKHAQEELQYYRGFVEQLLRAIRHGEQNHVDEIIGIIRAGAAEDEILRAASCCLTQRQNSRSNLPDQLAMSGTGTATGTGIGIGMGMGLDGAVIDE